MQNRENVALSAKVRTGILIDAVNGAAAAWAYMVQYRVPRQVILRVLATPAHRRDTDARHPLSTRETQRLGSLNRLQRSYAPALQRARHRESANQHAVVKPACAHFFPMPTLKTKTAVKLLQPGMRLKIDVVNTDNPQDWVEVDAWLVVNNDRVDFRFQDGPGGAPVNLGHADHVRIAIAAAPMVH